MILPYLFYTIGGLWIILGIADIIIMPISYPRETNEWVIVFGLIFNFIFFIFPGLLLVFLGAYLKDRSKENKKIEKKE